MNYEVWEDSEYNHTESGDFNQFIGIFETRSDAEDAIDQHILCAYSKNDAPLHEKISMTERHRDEYRISPVKKYFVYWAHKSIIDSIISMNRYKSVYCAKTTILPTEHNGYFYIKKVNFESPNTHGIDVIEDSSSNRIITTEWVESANEVHVCVIKSEILDQNKEDRETKQIFREMRGGRDLVRIMEDSKEGFLDTEIIMKRLNHDNGSYKLEEYNDGYLIKQTYHNKDGLLHRENKPALIEDLIHYENNEFGNVKHINTIEEFWVNGVKIESPK